MSSEGNAGRMSREGKGEIVLWYGAVWCEW